MARTPECRVVASAAPPTTSASVAASTSGSTRKIPLPKGTARAVVPSAIHPRRCCAADQGAATTGSGRSSRHIPMALAARRSTRGTRAPDDQSRAPASSTITAASTMSQETLGSRWLTRSGRSSTASPRRTVSTAMSRPGEGRKSSMAVRLTPSRRTSTSPSATPASSAALPGSTRSTCSPPSGGSTGARRTPTPESARSARERAARVTSSPRPWLRCRSTIGPRRARAEESTVPWRVSTCTLTPPRSPRKESVACEARGSEADSPAQRESERTSESVSANSSREAPSMRRAWAATSP
ncbi:MAG: hypothetical protein IPN17_15415 [Deltaproteobacteria bacterium]|nr:hypothetical protein [Deltaproteobacteria bacterium]